MSTSAGTIPKVGSRSTLDSEISSFLKSQPDLHLGGTGQFTAERAHHLKVFGFHNLSQELQSPIGKVEFTAIRGPHGTIPVRVFHPSKPSPSGEASALVYMHGGGYTVGSVDEFENGLRLLAEHSGAQIYGVEYRLAPEWSFPVQLDEYAAVLDWVQGEGGRARGVHPDRVCGGGDSAGGNMTAALSLRLRDEGKKNMSAQMLLYPEARLPFDTKAAAENNSGMYLECNGIFSFADHYATRGTPPSHPYVSPGMQETKYLRGVPPASVFTCGFDPLRDVGVEYASKLQEADVEVEWFHYDSLTHGFLQFAPWSKECMKATKDVAAQLREMSKR